jgi:hypothetical protein
MAEFILSNVGAQSRAEIVRGTAWAYVIDIYDGNTPENIAGRSYSCQFRTPDDTLIATATCTITNAAAGQFSVALSDAQTLAFVAGGDYLFTIVETNAGIREELIRGDAVIIDQVTRP